jgi:hypothetical protein
MKTRTKRILLLATAAVGLSLAPLAGVASADPAPTCVEASVHEDDSPDWAIAGNYCDSAQRVKILVAFGPDSACVTLVGQGEEGQVSTYHEWPDFGRFDGVVSC